jgi:hypothetical protein
MGMFDNVRCEIPLPDGWDGKGMQTKDLGCTMSTVTITAEGRLVGSLREWWWEEHKPERDLDFHGDFNFYGSEGQYGTPEYKWHDYVARFTEGRLNWIRSTSDSDGSAEGGETPKSGSTEGDSAGAKHIARPNAPTPPAPSKDHP